MKTTLFSEGVVKSNLRLAFAATCREAHEMNTDEEMTIDEAASALRFIEDNLDDLEIMFTEWVTDRLVNNQ